MKACSAETERELELMKLRKMLAWLTAMAMLGTAALATGCGSEETSSSKAETSAAETEEAADAADDADAEDGDSVDDETAAYADALAGTLWLGMDTEYNCYAMGFNEEEIVFEADDGSSASGYWGVTAGDPTIYIFDGTYKSDEVFKGPLGRRAITPLKGIKNGGYYDPTDPAA